MKQDNLRATPQPHGRPRKKSSLAAVGTAPSMEQRRGRAAALPRQCRRRRAPVPPTSCRHSIHARSHARLSCQSRAAALAPRPGLQPIIGTLRQPHPEQGKRRHRQAYSFTQGVAQVPHHCLTATAGPLPNLRIFSTPGTEPRRPCPYSNRRRALVPPTSCSKDTGASSQLRSFLVPRLVPAVRTRPTYVRELIEIFRRIDQIFSTAALKRYFRVRA